MGDPEVPSLSETGHSTPETFAQAELKPAPLRLSPKDKHSHETSNDRPHDTLDGSPRSPVFLPTSSEAMEVSGAGAANMTQPKTRSLADIVSRFEILDAMSNLERPVAPASGPHGSRASRPINEANFIRRRQKQESPPDVKWIHDPASGCQEREDSTWLSSSGEASPGLASIRAAQLARVLKSSPSADLALSASDRVANENLMDVAGKIAAGRKRSMVAERRRLFEPPGGAMPRFRAFGTVADKDKGASAMPSKSASMPLSTRHRTDASGSNPSPSMKLSRSKTWQTKARRLDDLSEAPRDRLEGMQSSAPESLGSTNSEKGVSGAGTVLRGRNKISDLWPRAINVFSRGAANPKFSAEDTGGNISSMDPAIKKEDVMDNEHSGQSWASTHQSGSETRYSSHPGATETRPEHREDVTLPPEPSDAAGKTIRGSVANLRKLFDRSSSGDNGTHFRLHVKCRRPAQIMPDDHHRTQVPYSDDNRYFRAEPSVGFHTDSRCFRYSGDYRLSKESNRSSIHDRINAFESLRRPNLEVTGLVFSKTEPLNRFPPVVDESKENMWKKHVANRFDSLSFSHGREIWRKLSASWDKSKSDDGGHSGRDDGEYSQPFPGESSGHQTRGRYHLSAGRTAGSWFLKKAMVDQDETAEHIVEQHPMTRRRDLQGRKSMPVSPQERGDQDAANNDDDVPRRLRSGRLPVSLTGPAAESGWSQDEPKLSHTPIRAKGNLSSQDTRIFSWGKRRTSKVKGLVVAKAECKIHLPQPVMPVRVDKMREEANADGDMNKATSIDQRF